MKQHQPFSAGKKYWDGLSVILLAGLVIWGTTSHAQLPPQEKKPLPAIEETQTITPNSLGTARLVYTLRGHTTTIQSLVFSRDGKTLISGGGTNEPFLKFWSVSEGEETGTIRAQSSAVLALAMTPNGQFLVSGGEDADIHFWSWPSKANPIAFFDHYSYVLSLAITPDSQILISGALDGIRVWTLRPPHLLYQLTGFGNPAYSLAVHPNGYLLASGEEEGRVRFWNLRERSIVSEFFPHKEPVSGLAITPDGKYLITASFDATIKIWDLATGALIHTLDGHHARIRAIALSPDGKVLASASNDGVRIWNVEQGRLLRYLTDHENWVNALAFSPDGRYLASGGFDRVIILWEIPPIFSDPPPSRVETLFNEYTFP